jgi:molybdopterin converting factor subunit 1
VVSPLPAPRSRPRISVLYFAALRELVGQGEEEIDLPRASLSVAELLSQLEQSHAGLRGRLAAVRVAVNEEFTELEASVQAGDVVALIPPVSGG